MLILPEYPLKNPIEYIPIGYYRCLHKDKSNNKEYGELLKIEGKQYFNRWKWTEKGLITKLKEVSINFFSNYKEIDKKEFWSEEALDWIIEGKK